VRNLEARVVIAASGVAAGEHGPPRPLPVPLLDARDPGSLARLADLVLGV